ncbi:MAG: N-acetyltransferase [Cyanobacteria bacterium J06642_11]
MKFIPATENNYQAIGHLVTSPEELYLVCPTGRYPWDVSQLRTIASQRHALTVGLIDQTVVAFSNLYDLVPQRSAFIGNVIVAKDHRGQGIGKALIQHMMTICQTTYGAVPHLSVFNNNTRALLLYTALGFVPYAVETRFDLHQNKVAMIHMRYVLS